MAAEGEQKKKHPWRDNIEALTMAVVVAVMLKYFVVEAYKIPSGSMQPTLLGNEETQIFDRIIVDKFSYHLRDPERWEVVVFKYPLDRSKNFIKRLVGMPGEQLKIEYGDLWARRDDSQPWQVLRRPRPVQDEIWKRIDPADPRFREWRVEDGTQGWTVEGRGTIHARGDGSALLPSDRGSVRDSYRDGYPGSMAEKLVKSTANYEVGDLRLVGEVEALPGCRAVVFELREGDRRYLFRLPGPAAPDEEQMSIRVEDLSSGSPVSLAEVAAQSGPRLRAGAGLRVTVQNMDDELAFDVDGRPQLVLDVEPARDQRSWFRVRVEGEGADLEDVQVYRDISYTTDNSPPPHQWQIPEGHYFMLGDNTQDSSDSRAWVFDRWISPEGDPEDVLRANYEGNRNPMIVPGDPRRGTLVWLRDEWGELHVFPQTGGTRLGQERAPFVPRELIAGRAVLVFWPHAPSVGVWRLQWIH